MTAIRHPTPIAPGRAGSLVSALAMLALSAAAAMPQSAARVLPGREALFYLTDAPDAIDSFESHAARATIVGAQCYRVDSLGNLAGTVPARVLEAARAHGVKVMPLIVNPGWNLALFHALVNDSSARARMIARMVELGKENGYWGWQFDFEQIALSDRDALTRLFRETAAALHAAGMTLSIAVYPDPGDLVGSTPYHAWLWNYLVGAYDLRALADAGDFLSLMTYLQHTARTPPGPIAGVPYQEKVVRRALALGVPPRKLSLGVPFFSMQWYTAWSEERKGYSWARGMDWSAAVALLRQYGATARWDEREGAEHAQWQHSGVYEYAWIEDARALQPKLDVARRFGLRGISVWRIGQEDPAVWPLIEAWEKSAR